MSTATATAPPAAGGRRPAPKAFADDLAITQLPVGVLLPVLGVLLVTSGRSGRR